MTRLWSRAECEWGLECFRAGDSVEEIAEMAGCNRQEVVANIGPGRLTPTQRQVLSFYAAGSTFSAINTELGAKSRCAEAVVTSLRAQGYPVPYRRDAEAGQ